jgi:hypothetical protein
MGVDTSGATICLRRVLGLIGHLASKGTLLVLLGEGKVSLSGASPAMDDHREDQAEENNPCAREVAQ